MIDLEKAAYTLGHAMYEPEQFPGLIYRMEEPKVVILLFASGKLVCTGAKTRTRRLRRSRKTAWATRRNKSDILRIRHRFYCFFTCFRIVLRLS